MSTKLIELARKLNELAKRGIDGEKETAERKLAELMEKHGISLEDIEAETTTDVQFYYASALEQRLLLQIAASVGVTSYGENTRTRNVWLTLTASQRIEVEFKYDIYRRALKEELEIFLRAFIHKNDIYDKKREPIKTSDLTREEKEIILRAQLMSEGIKKANVHKQLQG